MDEPTYESRQAELDRIDGLLTEIECHVIFREVARRRPWILATADVRETARLIIEKHYRLWRAGQKPPRLWPWNKLAGGPPQMSRTASGYSSTWRATGSAPPAHGRR
jgi:hypothetical protein